jgi:hypothetical protein
MANLIIKSSADNLVLQGSDASPAITVGATGTTTFAEAATMSGNVTMSGTANNLGTTTAGTLSSGVVFPSGHVVQTSTLNKGSTNTNIGTGTATWTSTVVTHAITPIYSNSAIIVHANFLAHMSDSGSDGGYNFRWLKTGTGIAADTYPAGMHMAVNQTGSDAHAIYEEVYAEGKSLQHQLTLMDENVTVADTAVTYTLQAHTYNVSTYAKFGSSTWDNYQWSIFFQEIKR